MAFVRGDKTVFGCLYWIIDYLCINFKLNDMKLSNKIIIILLNILFCAAVLWFFSNNSSLRPWAGSTLKECISALFLLGSLYLNYFLLYPKLFHKYPYVIYWLILVFIALVTGLIDIAIAYPYFMSRNGAIVQEISPALFSYFFCCISGRNLAFNFFPFLLRERKHYEQSLNNEVKIVYRDVRKLDVTDKDNNIRLVDIDDIFYCHQQGNFTEIYTMQNDKYTRLGSMKHLEQLFGTEDFIRITSNVLVPFRYLDSCNDNTVIMKKMPWEKEPIVFKLEPKTQEKIAERIEDVILKHETEVEPQSTPEQPVQPKAKQKPATPPEEKLEIVLSYIKKHPNCNTGDIVAETKIPLSTIERYISVLKSRGRIKHSGSKKKGGYTITQQKPLTGE
jgi:predicted transcriptional regulator